MPDAYIVSAPILPGNMGQFPHGVVSHQSSMWGIREPHGVWLYMLWMTLSPQYMLPLVIKFY